MLDGKVVLITGASGGLGSITTQVFLDSGARVAAAAHSIDGVETSRFLPASGELRSLADAQALVQRTLDKWSRLDALVHLIGAFDGGKPLHETDDATLDRMLDINLRAAFHLIRAVLPAMRAKGTGRILAIGSRAAADPVATLGAYAASKAALVSLIRTVALENKDRSITANILLPGTLDTPANRRYHTSPEPPHWVPPIDVAKLLIHLTSDYASSISGAVIPIPGGDL